MNIGACRHLDDTSMETCCVFFLFFITSEEEVALGETLFTPETPKVICGRKHFLSPAEFGIYPSSKRQKLERALDFWGFILLDYLGLG